MKFVGSKSQKGLSLWEKHIITDSVLHFIEHLIYYKPFFDLLYVKTDCQGALINLDEVLQSFMVVGLSTVTYDLKSFVFVAVALN